MKKIVVSASRRTDIPAFYMDWFMAGIERGLFTVVNPYNGVERQVPAGPDQVHTIVFWSKDFARFLEGEYGEQLASMGYHLFFNFTVNSEDRILEPRLPALGERLNQLAELSRRFGPERIHWRFDPICFYVAGDGKKHDNTGDFSRIARAAAGAGVTACIASFVDLYRKVTRRVERVPGLSLTVPDLNQQTAVISRMAAELAVTGMSLSLCCEKEVLAALPPESSVRAASCVPGHDFVRRDGGSISLGRDQGQRAAAGCGCTVSADVGSYRDHPCCHDCLFCYANPSRDRPPGRHFSSRANGRKAPGG